MPELIPSPHQPSKGMSADGAKYLQAISIAQQTGKSVEEVLAFMGVSTPIGAPVAVAPPPTTVPAQSVPPELEDKAAILAIPEEEEIQPTAKAKAPSSKKEAIPDETGFVVTETIDPANATESELDQLPSEDDENDWSGKIREGSKVKVTWQAPGNRIKWEGKKGKVTRVIGNENAKIYEVEFAAGKIQKVRINKKTGKLERGYVTKKLCGTFSEDQVELVD